MKTIIIIIASFLCVNLFAQHQAQFDEETPHKKVFKEVFNDSSETAQNGGTITDVTFSNGKGSFNGSSSTINYNKHLPNGNYSIRAKITTGAIVTGGNQYAIIGGGTNQFYIISTNNKFSHYDGSGVAQSTTIAQPNTSYDVVFTFDGTNVKIYVDGNLESTTAQNRINNELTYVGSYNGSVNYFLGTIDLVEIFNVVLTAEEVSNLYNNKRYKELNVSPVLEVSSESGTIVSDSSFVNTGVDVVRDGSIWVMDFDGVSDYIESVDNILGDEDFTISFWVYSDKINQEDVYLFSEYEDSDNRWYIRLRANLGLQLYSEVGGVPATNTDFTTLNTEPDTWNYIGLSISRSDSMYYKYLNGELVHSAKGSSDFTLDLDNAGKFEIGRYTGSTYGKMKLSDFKIDDVVWTDEEFSQYYTSTKRKYGK